MLRDNRNDIVREELDGTPFRHAALLLLPVNSMPCVGQVWELVLPASGEHQAAIAHGLERHGGFLGCAVGVRGAQVLPRGCVGVEVQDMARPSDDQIIVTVRGVNCLRIIDRSQPTGGSFPLPLVQEVMEWTDYEESNGGEESVSAAMRDLMRLFNSCGDLQHRTGIWAAGDLYSRTLEELTSAGVAAVGDVQFSGIAGVGSTLKAAEQRRAVLAAHAAVMALKDGKKATFLCDPCSVLRRMQQLTKFLTLTEELLGSRVQR